MKHSTYNSLAKAYLSDPHGPTLRDMTAWNSFDTAGPVSVTAELITISGGGGDEVHAYAAHPHGDGPRPGLVYLHHLPGWDEFTQETVERLARHGYDVIAPDLYCRYGHGAPDDVAAKVRSEGGVHDSSVVADAAAALAWLKGRATHSGRTGVIGPCSGGRHALLAASLVDGFDAVVDLWGGNVMPGGEPTEARPVPPADYTDRLSIPLLGIFGNDDQNPTPAQVDAHEALLREAGKDHEFHRYDGAGHAFFYYHTDRYRPVQAMDAWEKVLAFLTDKLDRS